MLLEFHNKDIQHARGVIPSVIAHVKKRAILDRAYERGTNYKEEVDSYAQEQQMFRTYMYNHPGTSLLRGEVVSTQWSFLLDRRMLVLTSYFSQITMRQL